MKGGRVVKGIRFLDLRDAGDPVKQARFYEKEGADELVFLDITAAAEKRKTMVELARRTADGVFMPFTIGGGIGSLEDIRAILKAGADKVSLNTAALLDPHLIGRAAGRFGSQCVVVAIDAKLQKTEGRGQRTEHREQKAEDRRQKAEDRRQKAEDRRQKAEGGMRVCHLTTVL